MSVRSPRVTGRHVGRVDVTLAAEARTRGLEGHPGRPQPGSLDPDRMSPDGVIRPMITDGDVRYVFAMRLGAPSNGVPGTGVAALER
jgi:hypothetical protein